MQLSIFVRLYGTYVQRRENGPFFCPTIFFPGNDNKIGFDLFWNRTAIWEERTIIFRPYRKVEVVRTANVVNAAKCCEMLGNCDKKSMSRKKLE